MPSAEAQQLTFASVEFSGFSDVVQVGEGGLGRVYRATRISTGGIVAIKELRDIEYASPAVSRARRELNAMLQLKGHPHVVSVEEIIDGPNGPLLVMEFAPNGSVMDRFERFGNHLPEHEVVIVGLHVADGLAAAHQLNIVHRDVKPHNLLIGAFGQVKVCDFGIAVVAAPDQRTATRAYTLDYASPEQLDGGDVAAPSDVYSYAATLLHLLSGHRLTFRERMELGTRQWGTIAPSLRPLLDPLRAALNTEPNVRPSMADLLAEFETVADDIGLRHRALDTKATSPTAPPAPRAPTARATRSPLADVPDAPEVPITPAVRPVRSVPVVPVVPPAPSVPPPPPPRPQAPAAHQPAAHQPAAQSTTAPRAATAVAAARSIAAPPAATPTTDRRSPWFWVALMSVLAVLSGGITWAALAGGGDNDDSPQTTDSGGEPIGSLGPEGSVVPPSDPVNDRALFASGVRANCQAPDSADASSQPIVFDPTNVTDGVTTTAWRCAVGSADDPTLIFSFDSAVTLGAVGLIGGYTKVDPTTQVDRYPENFRVKTVVWTFSDGSTVTQELQDGVREVQILNVAVTTTEVQMTITDTYESDFPVGNVQRKEFVAVTEVVFGG